MTSTESAHTYTWHNDMTKAASASFIAMFLGFFVPFVTIESIVFIRLGHLHEDFSPVLFWPASYIYMAWFFVILPIVMVRKLRTPLSDPSKSWYLFCALGIACYAAIVVLSGGYASFFLKLAWFPIIVGLSAGVAFPIIMKWKSRWYVDLSTLAIAATIFVLGLKQVIR